MVNTFHPSQIFTPAVHLRPSYRTSNIHPSMAALHLLILLSALRFWNPSRLLGVSTPDLLTSLLRSVQTNPAFQIQNFHAIKAFCSNGDRNQFPGEQNNATANTSACNTRFRVPSFRRATRCYRPASPFAPLRPVVARRGWIPKPVRSCNFISN